MSATTAVERGLRELVERSLATRTVDQTVDYFAKSERPVTRAQVVDVLAMMRGSEALNARRRNRKPLLGNEEEQARKAAAQGCNDMLRAMLMAGQHTLRLTDAWTAGASVGLSWQQIKRGIGAPAEAAA
jgi:hypothetical protein